ncbi:CCA tRNA nucleotidyltransferase [Sulfurimonas sp.]
MNKTDYHINLKIGKHLHKMIITYPKVLNKIFNELYKHKIKPIIVGGYIRDFILNIESNDIDIELYNVASLQDVEKILKQFGNVNNVGKSFGVCKLQYENLDLDFSLPRIDSKISQGHLGFTIKVDPSLDFKSATSRRDFTINAIGYDIKNNKLLDPFYGVEDLKNKKLKAVDINKFDEDPLRVMRAVMFASRFEFDLYDALFCKCKKMMNENVLLELPPQRIFQEIKKLLLKSKKPSYGFLLLKKIDGFHFFNEFNSLKEEEYYDIIYSLDCFKSYNLCDKKESITIMLALLLSKFSTKQIESFLSKLTNSKKIFTDIMTYVQTQFNLAQLDNYNLYKLSTRVNIEIYSYYLNAVNHNKKNKDVKILLKKAHELNILNKKREPLLEGKDLINFNLKPSKLFSKILEDAYDAQLKEKFKDKKEALAWLKQYLSNF